MRRLIAVLMVLSCVIGSVVMTGCIQVGETEKPQIEVGGDEKVLKIN